MTQGFGDVVRNTDKEVIPTMLPLSDESGFIMAKMYEDYQQSIMRYLIRRVHDWHQAEDLCHDTFLKACTAISRGDPNIPATAEDFLKWLYRIAHNTAIDHHRRNKRLEFRSLLDNSEFTIEGHEERIVERVQLYEMLTELPLQQRETVIRRHLLGYSEKEVAASLGITEKAVSSNASRGKEHLNRKYFPVTIDLKRAEELQVKDVIDNLPRGARGTVSWERFQEQVAKARDWRYRQYMRKHISELRDSLFFGDDYPIDFVC
jgi:RNA polymerase sigma-70 factor (ECF subfamily)